jgi:hypothetical protein
MLCRSWLTQVQQRCQGRSQNAQDVNRRQNDQSSGTKGICLLRFRQVHAGPQTLRGAFHLTRLEAPQKASGGWRRMRQLIDAPELFLLHGCVVYMSPVQARPLLIASSGVKFSALVMFQRERP